MNSPMNRRNVEIVVKTRSVSSLWDEPAGSLVTGRAATAKRSRSAPGSAGRLSPGVASCEDEDRLLQG